MNIYILAQPKVAFHVVLLHPIHLALPKNSNYC